MQTFQVFGQVAENCPKIKLGYFAAETAEGAVELARTHLAQFTEDEYAIMSAQPASKEGDE